MVGQAKRLKAKRTLKKAVGAAWCRAIMKRRGRRSGIGQNDVRRWWRQERRREETAPAEQKVLPASELVLYKFLFFFFSIALLVVNS